MRVKIEALRAVGVVAKMWCKLQWKVYIGSGGASSVGTVTRFGDHCCY